MKKPSIFLLLCHNPCIFAPKNRTPEHDKGKDNGNNNICCINGSKRNRTARQHCPGQHSPQQDPAQYNGKGKEWRQILASHHQHRDYRKGGPDTRSMLQPWRIVYHQSVGGCIIQRCRHRRTTDKTAGTERHLCTDAHRKHAQPKRCLYTLLPWVRARAMDAEHTSEQRGIKRKKRL